jgi:hypothetical protein
MKGFGLSLSFFERGPAFLVFHIFPTAQRQIILHAHNKTVDQSSSLYSSSALTCVLEQKVDAF